MQQRAALSPRDLARAIGVSESSIKRWADEGLIQVSKTAGGHRRIPIDEAVRFVHRSEVTVVRPELLDLPDIAALDGRSKGEGAGQEIDTDAETEELFGYLESGAAAKARGYILALYLDGRDVAQIADGPVRGALHRLGGLWHHGEEGIFFEHRATQICLQAIHHLHLTLTSAELRSAPAAVGGAPPGDVYALPSLLAATVLTAEGFQAVNLGPQTPLATLARAAADDPRTRLAWLSVSHLEQASTLSREIHRLLDGGLPEGAALAIGGRASAELRLPRHPRLATCASMAELQAFARGLVASGG